MSKRKTMTDDKEKYIKFVSVKANNFINERGFTLIELMTSLVLTLIILAISVGVFSSALNSRRRESSKTDAIASTQAALNIISREIGNAGYGLTTNGIVEGTSNMIHIRSNIINNNSSTNDYGEDLTFYWDGTSVVRYDSKNSTSSGVINSVSKIEFKYFYFDPVTKGPKEGVASPDTIKVKIILTVILPPVQGQPSGQTVTVSSDVALRNSPNTLSQY